MFTPRYPTPDTAPTQTTVPIPVPPVPAPVVPAQSTAPVVASTAPESVPAPVSGRPVVQLSVVDDGPGIPPAERQRVFDRFYRIEESRTRESGGTGLGLPIVRDLVRLHGGSVRLTDRADHKPGLQALVVLPLDQPDSQDTASSVPS